MQHVAQSTLSEVYHVEEIESASHNGYQETTLITTHNTEFEIIDIIYDPLGFGNNLSYLN